MQGRLGLVAGFSIAFKEEVIQLQIAADAVKQPLQALLPFDRLLIEVDHAPAVKSLVVQFQNVEQDRILRMPLLHIFTGKHTVVLRPIAGESAYLLELKGVVNQGE